MPSANDIIGGMVQRGPDIGGATQALKTMTEGTVSSAMPSFYQALQGIREGAVRRGISTGDLGTSYEGDLASAFQRNTANAVAGQAEGLYQGNMNRYTDLVTGQRDYDTAQANARRKRNAGLWGTLGTIGGTLIGGPAGGAIGGALGSTLGGY